MAELSDISRVIASASDEPPPNWDLVPFDVGCPRCGTDLRGTTGSTCAECDLDLPWSEIVPLHQLTCPSCSYHLFGLPDPRCPECGQSFDWEKVLDEYHRQRKPLFEYRWRTQPVKSFVRTWAAALRPSTFWSRVELHDPVRPWPLLVTLSVFFAFFTIPLVLMEGMGAWLAMWTFRQSYSRPGWRPFGIRDLPDYMVEAIFASDAYYTLWAMAIWSACIFAALMIFRQSMRRSKIRTSHVLRVWVLTVLPLAPVVAGATSLCYWTCRAMGMWIDLSHPAIVIVVVYATYSLSRAYRYYLQMPHSELVAICVLIMALSGTIIGELATLPNVRLSISYALLEWFGLA